MSPTKEEAFQFAVMLSSGVPASDAILYFTDEENPTQLSEMLRVWMKSRLVKQALVTLQGKEWTEMSLEEALTGAINKHYRDLAYLLHTRHYAEVGQTDKSKLDSARQAIEAKLAGTAGKGDALSEFFADIKAGRLKLNPGSPLSGIKN